MIDEDAAEDIIARLPEVETFMQLMEASDDVSPIIILDEEGDAPGEGYMVFTVAESHPTHVVPWQRFFVKKAGGEIVVADVIDGGFLSLGAWRKKYATDIDANRDALARAKTKK